MNKLININTITPIYDSLEDRIRLSINYQNITNRIDMMLTRSFMLQLLPAIEEYIYKHYPDEPIEDEVNVELTYSNALTEASEVTDTPPSNRTPTNFEDFELHKGLEDLIRTINLTYDKNTKLTTLTLISKDKYQAVITCNIDTLKSIIDTIKQSVPKLQWGIGYL